MEAMDIGTATWAVADAGPTMAGAEAAITVGDNDRPDQTARGRLNWRPLLVEDAGFTSVEAVDADEAVAILESRSDIAPLLTDIQMPGTMDGLGLAHSVHERWPPIRIILVSGQLKLTTSKFPPTAGFSASRSKPRK
jgi:DNA-binding NtrC family response regulator